MKKILFAIVATVISSSALADGICGYPQRNKVSGDVYLTQYNGGARAAQAVIMREDVTEALIQSIRIAQDLGKMMCANINSSSKFLSNNIVRVKTFRIRE